MTRHMTRIGGAVTLLALLGACAPGGRYGDGHGYSGYSYGGYRDSSRPYGAYPTSGYYQGRACPDGSWCDRDNNPPGPTGGPGTNWENPPGPRGGPGASPDRRDYYRRN
jgi:hypothetical protein